ncbi:MAG: Hpt domain-containing protein, partial [Rhodoferax sp.]|nr:Hpt domain-containing protein [Rhodoferax sp.]
MADTSTDNAGASFDLSQFHQVFFEEAGENLERMEQQLLEIDIESADDETLNSIFRCAHSVKGGAATFGFSDVAGLTHQMETLLDKLRRHELEPDAAMVDVLLQSGDALKAQLALHQSGGKGEPVETAHLLASYAAFIAGEKPAAPVAAAPSAPKAAAAPVAEQLPKGQRALELLVGPLDMPAEADQLVELFAEIVDLGTIEPLDGGQAADGMRRFKVITGSTDDDLLDLFTFHVAREKVKLLPLGPGFGFHAGAPGAPPEEAPPAPAVVEDTSFGFFDDAPGAPGSQPAPAAAAAAPATKTETKAAPRAAAAPAAEA